MREDQTNIKKLISDLDYKNNFVKINKSHIVKLNSILNEITEPRISILSQDGALAAWLIVQHADYNVEFQKDYLNLTKELLKKDPEDVYLQGIAYLEDRIAIKENKLQVYGTQFHDSNTDPKTLIPHPILDPKNLNLRRKKMGLQSIEEYIKELSEVYGKKVNYTY